MGARIPFQPLPVDQSHVVYDHGPHSAPRPGVTAGRTTRLRLADSRSFPGTSRHIWVHAPAAPDSALPCMVFQDGGGFLDPEDDLRAGTVLDNLIAAGDIRR